MLDQFDDLFDGTLGKWKGSDYKIELKEGVTPYHAKAYPVPRISLETFKEQVRLLEEAGVLKRVNNSEWAAPTGSMHMAG